MLRREQGKDYGSRLGRWDGIKLFRWIPVILERGANGLRSSLNTVRSCSNSGRLRFPLSGGEHNLRSETQDALAAGVVDLLAGPQIYDSRSGDVCNMGDGAAAGTPLNHPRVQAVLRHGLSFPAADTVTVDLSFCGYGRIYP